MTTTETLRYGQRGKKKLCSTQRNLQCPVSLFWKVFRTLNTLFSPPNLNRHTNPNVVLTAAPTGPIPAVGTYSDSSTVDESRITPRTDRRSQHKENE